MSTDRSPPSSPCTPESTRNERGRERAAEDERFVPVILKRSDEVVRHPDDTLEKAIEGGREQLERRGLPLGLSAVAAGLILGFSAMAVAVVEANLADDVSLLARRLAVALVYPLGFVLCILSGAELFTEHTATAVYPVLDRRAGIPALLRLWAIVFIGNLIGAAAVAGLLFATDDVVGAAAGYRAIGDHLFAPSARSLFMSAILAGWLMALGAWLLYATPPTVIQVVAIFIVTFLIGFGGLHHSIAGSVEGIAAALFSPEIGFAEVARFIVLAATGNLVGGSVFVAALNYSHIRKLEVDRD